MRAPILTYHSLDDSGSVISLRPALFRRHMEVLRERGFQGITLRELLAAWDGEAAPSGRPVVLTFDDGLRTAVTEAAPVLREMGFRATVFAVAGRSGGDNRWPGQAAWAPREDLLTSADLRDLARAGWEVGAHGLTHASLDGLGAAARHEEVVTSKSVLEEQIGAEVTAFAYPYGAADAAARALVARYYRGACSTDLAVARHDHDRHWLPRIDAYYVRRPELLRLLETTAGRAYLAARTVGRRLRRMLLAPARGEGWSS
jgi:peptidoglycan/xylan/chitin deacetylase (PgdA/CDA1 family)